MNSDLVAKRFLTELNGFDFLLDRLFSKQKDEKDEKEKHEEEDKNGSESEEEEDEGGDNLMKKIMNKLKTSKTKEPKKKEDKIALKTLPTMSK